jgi:ribonuclease HI
MPYYVVFEGRKPGIYKTWTEVKPLVDKYPNAKYKSYSMITEATEAFNGYTNQLIYNDIVPEEGSIAPTNASSNIVSLIDKYYSMNDWSNILNFYTDGSVKNNGKKYATGSYGVFYSDPRIMPISQEIKIDKVITTPISELLGIIEGIKRYIKSGFRYTEINLYTDSEYCYKSLTKWITGWLRNDWKTASKRKGMVPGEVKNKEEIMTAYLLISEHSIKIHHINSHTGKQDLHSIGNEIADMLTKCY